MMRRHSRLLWTILPAAAAACSEAQSTLAPHGADAARIAWLSLVMFVGAIAVLLIVFGALIVAIAGSERWRRVLARQRTVTILGVAFPAVALVSLLAYTLWVTRFEFMPPSPPALRIEVTGEQWWWRIAYLLPDGRRIAEANEVRIPVGGDVEFVLRSTDVIHSFWAPSLGGKLDMIPGRINRLRLTADRSGIYRGQCAEYCGGPHALMAFEITAMPLPDFQAWLDGADRPRPEPQTEHERRGRDLFLAAGCGACHAVRGIIAEGMIGPDLSRIGERRFLAAGAMPGGRDNIARFIAHGQAVKPGNQMPEFKILSDTELDAIAAYLVNLR